MSDDTESRALRGLRDLVESGRPLAYIHSAEERRVTRLLREAATRFFTPPAPLWIWSITEGMRRDGAAGTPMDAREAVEHVVAHEGPGIFLLKDFHDPMRESAEIRRRLRDVYELARESRKLVVILSPVKVIPDEIAQSVVYVELAVPDLPELEDFVRHEGAALQAAGGTA